MLEDFDNYFNEETVLRHELDTLLVGLPAQNDIRDQNHTEIFNAEGNQHVGDIMMEQKPEGIIRMYGINVNGVKWDTDGGNWPEICQAMEACNADLVAISELNLEMGRYEIQRKMDTVCKQYFKNHQLITATSGYKAHKTYKPGGTAIMVCNDMKAQVTSWHRDRMGRWVAI